MEQTPESGTPRKFFECGCCGDFHETSLDPGIDCRDDKHRFSLERLFTEVGKEGIDWEEVQP